MFSSEELKLLENKYNLALASVDEIKQINYYPSYPAAISEFMACLVQSPWGDYNYKPEHVSTIMEKIESATFDEIRWVLTASNRAERFCDGSWRETLEKQKLTPVFKRLNALLEV